MLHTTQQHMHHVCDIIVHQSTLYCLKLTVYGHFSLGLSWAVESWSLGVLNPSRIIIIIIYYAIHLHESCNIIQCNTSSWRV